MNSLKRILLRSVVAGFILLSFLTSIVGLFINRTPANNTLDKEIDKLGIYAPANFKGNSSEKVQEIRRIVREIIFDAFYEAILRSDRLHAIAQIMMQKRYIRVLYIPYEDMYVDFDHDDTKAFIKEKYNHLNGQIGVKLLIIKARDYSDAERIANNPIPENTTWCRVMYSDNGVLFVDGDKDLFKSIKDSEWFDTPIYATEIFSSYVLHPESCYELGDNSIDSISHMQLLCIKDKCVETITKKAEALLNQDNLPWVLNVIEFNDNQYPMEYCVKSFATPKDGYFVHMFEDHCELVVIQDIIQESINDELLKRLARILSKDLIAQLN